MVSISVHYCSHTQELALGEITRLGIKIKLYIRQIMAGELKPSRAKSLALIGEGDSSFSQIPCFTTARSLLSAKEKICHVSCGATVSVVLASTRSGASCVLEWGTNMYGERLTIAAAYAEDPIKDVTAPREMEDETTSRTMPQNSKNLRHPTIVSPTMLPVGEIVRQIACGAHFVVATIVSGGCITWGGQGGKVAQRGLGRGGCGDCRSCFAASSANRSVESAAASSRPRREGSSSRTRAQWVEDPLGRRGYEVTLLAAGDDHVVAVCQNSEVWAWGRGDCGQLGIGTPLTPDDRSDSCRPARILIPPRGDSHSYWKSGNSEVVAISAIACGRDHSAIVTRRGELWTFGSGLYGQLGMGTIGGKAWIPTRVDSLDGIGSMRADGTFTGMTSVACGAWHTVALSTTGDLYSWGWARFGALGPTLSNDDYSRDTSGERSGAQGGRASRSSSPRKAGDAEVRPYPGLVLGIDDVLEGNDSVVSVGCGARYTLALTREERAFVWGQVSPMDGLDSDRNFGEAQGRMGTSKALFSRPRELNPSKMLRCDGTESVRGVADGAEPSCQPSRVRGVKETENTGDAVDSSRWVVSTAGCGPWYLVLGIETRPREGYRADEGEDSASLRSSPEA